MENQPGMHGAGRRSTHYQFVSVTTSPVRAFLWTANAQLDFHYVIDFNVEKEIT